MSVAQYGTIIEQVAITATSGGTTTLTNISKELQVFNGSANQTLVLPVATSYTKPGAKFEIYNLSTGSIQVQHQDSSAIQTISANSTLIVKLVDNTTANGTWVTLTNSTVPSVNAPTLQKFLSTGTQTGTLFDISAPASNISVGAVYTNNSNSFTVQNAVTTSQSGYVLYCTGAGTTSGSTLTLSSGTGPANLTFSATQALATYTTPSNPSPLYLKVTVVGGGGGGAGTSGSGSSGNFSSFGASVIVANGGSGGTVGAGAIALGGSASFGSGVSPIVSVNGGSGSGGTQSISSGNVGAGTGGSSGFGGGGGGGGANGVTGGSGFVGGGGGGAGTNDGNFSGGGGGAGGFAIGFISAPSPTYLYSVGTGGGGGGGGAGGGAGGGGIIIIEEHYQ